jgi:hypothetical protein
MFQLAKVWVDNTPNTHTVEIRYTWSKLGEPPSWNGQEEVEVMSVVPNTNPSMRLAAIEIPRYLDHEPNYLLHYRFGGGGEFHEGFNQDLTEEIVSREVEYVDNEGLITEVRVLWSVGGWSAPNWSQAKLKGLKLNTLEREAGSETRGDGMADEAIYELVQTVPLPRRFVARIWAPRVPPWSTPFSFCALIHRRRRATSRGGTIISRRTTAWCFERMRAVLNDGTHPLRVCDDSSTPPRRARLPLRLT